MIEEIKIRAIKSIADITLSCSNLNLFVGTNSSGKSTVIQSILLISQNIEYKYGLNGPLISLGDFRDIKNFNINEKEMVISVKGEGAKLKLQINENIIYNTDSQIINSKLFHDLNYNNQKLHYLSCHRIGSRDTYEKNLYNIDPFGINGEYTINYLMEHGSDEIDNKLIKYHESFTLLNQVNYWLKYIINANVSTENVIGTDIVKARYSIIDGMHVRPKNVGSGISYLVSIIILCLATKEDDIVLIENPEIHLHPLSQSRLCEFLYFIAQSGRQLFVETHSAHFFNGIRAGIALNNFEENMVKVYFFSLDDNNCTNSTEIKFGRRGKILNPIDNLFDQFDTDLNKMLGI